MQFSSLTCVLLCCVCTSIVTGRRDYRGGRETYIKAPGRSDAEASKKRPGRLNDEATIDQSLISGTQAIRYLKKQKRQNRARRKVDFKDSRGPDHTRHKYFAAIPCEISLKDYKDIKLDTKSLIEKFNLHLKEIKQTQRQDPRQHQQQQRQQRYRLSLPLQLDKDDWAFIKYLPPIIDVTLDDLRRANTPHASIHQVKRLLALANSESHDALFSADAAKYLKTFFMALNASLVGMDYKDYMSQVKSQVALSTALELLDSLYKSEDEIIPDYYELEKWL